VLTLRFALDSFPEMTKLAILSLLIAVPSVAFAQKPLKISSIEDFEACVDNTGGSDSCLSALTTYLKKAPGQQFAGAKSVRLKFNAEVAVPFFDRALAGKFDQKLCADDDLKLAIEAGLGVPSSYKVVPQAQRILGKKCFAELKPGVRKLVDEDPTGYVAQNACVVFAENKEPCKQVAAAPVAAPAAPAPFVNVDPSKIAVQDDAKVFVGLEGRRVTVVMIKGDPTGALLKFEGIRGDWNKKVVFHRLVETDRGVDYLTQVNKADFVSLVGRKSYGGSDLSYELYPNGDKGPYVVGYDAVESKAAKSAAVLAEFKKK
jgi:hypothetical protein